MTDFRCYFLFAFGLALIIKSSDYFVDGAIRIARISRVPEIVVGATLVSLCTTLPETVISTVSSAHGMPEMAFGNAFGSIACNTAFILGLTLTIARPPIQNRAAGVRSLVALVLLLAGCGLLLLATRGAVPRAAGWVLLGLLAVYLIGAVRCAPPAVSDARPSAEAGRGALWRSVLFLAVGATGVVVGSRLVVDNGAAIARALGVSELIVGLTFTALGSSLPELVTAVAAMAKRAHNLSVGNIIGADILNILLVSGLSAAVEPMRVELGSALFTVAFDFVAVMALLTCTLTNRDRYRRANGLLLLGLYAVYLAVNLLRFAH